jgi:hypothetical protein
VRSWLIYGEAVACNENGLAVSERLRHRPQDARVFLYAFDLLAISPLQYLSSKIRVPPWTIALPRP